MRHKVLQLFKFWDNFLNSYIIKIYYIDGIVGKLPFMNDIRHGKKTPNNWKGWGGGHRPHTDKPLYRIRNMEEIKS